MRKEDDADEVCQKVKLIEVLKLVDLFRKKSRAYIIQET